MTLPHFINGVFRKVKFFFEIQVFIKQGVTSWYQSCSLSEPLAIGVGLGLKLM